MALRVCKKVVSKKMNAKSCREICVPLEELVSGVLEHKGLEHMVQSRLTDCEVTKAKKYKLVIHSGSFKEQVQTKYSAWYSKTQFRMWRGNTPESKALLGAVLSDSSSTRVTRVSVWGLGACGQSRCKYRHRSDSWLYQKQNTSARKPKTLNTGTSGLQPFSSKPRKLRA